MIFNFTEARRSKRSFVRRLHAAFHRGVRASPVTPGGVAGAANSTNGSDSDSASFVRAPPSSFSTPCNGHIRSASPAPSTATRPTADAVVSNDTEPLGYVAACRLQAAGGCVCRFRRSVGGGLAPRPDAQRGSNGDDYGEAGDACEEADLFDGFSDSFCSDTDESERAVLVVPPPASAALPACTACPRPRPTLRPPVGLVNGTWPGSPRPASDAKNFQPHYSPFALSSGAESR
ncbi:hypothetical protein SPI_04542 [Niveomyces insectorum RCEF 264]|uniref:Uncharacterized protein n=1 Tax=Niveomyces insectorum RCEF 264 TaxID=1081102 RepID=A0A167UL95_9HYPO|nr:hypothetical protein SPI_04542 [Niveomyces insectorum RCEF 264]